MSLVKFIEFGIRPKPYLPYWIIVFLLFLQTAAVCFTHCLTARLALTDSLLLVIVLANKGFKCSEKSPCVLRFAGLIAFEALIFVNLTHAVQMLIDRHDEGVHLKGIYVGLTLIDITVKIWLMCMGQLPRPFLGLVSNLLLHFSATTATLLVAAIEQFDKNIVLYADPLITITTCIVLSAVALPSFCRSMPILFGDIPKNFKIEEFKKDLAATFSSTTCDHMHAYRVWPGNSFDVFLNITYRCSMDTDEWLQKAQCDFMNIQNQIRKMLRAAGANSVTVQLDIVKDGALSTSNHCVGNGCRNKSCCDFTTIASSAAQSDQNM